MAQSAGGRSIAVHTPCCWVGAQICRGFHKKNSSSRLAAACQTEYSTDPAEIWFWEVLRSEESDQQPAAAIGHARERISAAADLLLPAKLNILLILLEIWKWEVQDQ
jgi:hypothetical protein